MLYASGPDGSRVLPSKSARASCPCCDAPVIAKCGEIVSHHWAHESAEDCDHWHSWETDWHRGWKMRFPEGCREIVMGERRQHRADVRLPSGAVVEFQSKGLSPEEFEERERFYGVMSWIFDASEPFSEGRIRLRENASREHSNEHGVTHIAPNTLFAWASSWRSIWHASQPKYLDLGDGRVLWVRAPSERADEWGSAVVLDAETVVRHLSHTPGSKGCHLLRPSPLCNISGTWTCS